MAAKHIVQRFDFDPICAGVLRIIDNPILYSKYKSFLKEEWFFYNDSSDQARDLREVIKLLHTAHADGSKRANVSIAWMKSWIPTKFIDDVVGPRIVNSFNSWLNNINIKKSMADEKLFELFTDYLKVIVIAKGSKDFYESYQNGNPDLAAEYIQAIVSEIGSIGKEDREVLNALDMLSILEDAASKKHNYAMYLGCPGLDTQIGGFEKQTLNLFISVTNGGKTTMSHHLIRQCLKNKIPAFVACVEDRRDSFIRKIVACYTGLEIRQLKNPNNLTPSEKNLIIECMQLMNEYIRVEFIYGESVSAIHKASAEYDLDLTLKGKINRIPVVHIVDYTGHIAGKASGDKMYEKMRTAYGERKDYALKNHKICFDFAQVNREGSKKLGDNQYLSQTDLAGAFDIAQVCDNIITINRSAENVTNQTCVLALTKCRDGAVGVKIGVKTEFAKARYNMEDWDVIDAPSGIREELNKLRDGNTVTNIVPT